MNTVVLNYLNTSFVSITGLISVLGQCCNGLERIMHSPSARALSRLSTVTPPSCTKPRTASI